MSTLRALAQAQAVAAGVAQPVATVRHLHLSERPLVLVPLAMAGEANAPLAAPGGHRTGRGAAADRAAAPQPATSGSRSPPSWPGSCCRTSTRSGASPRRCPTDRGRDVRYRYVDAPQLLVPNPAGVDLPAAARPLHPVPAAGRRLPGAPGGAAARPLADLLRRAGRAPRLVGAAGDDRGADPALGDRAERGGGPAPAGAARLDRPAGRADRRGGGRPGRGPDGLPAGRPGHRPGLRQPAAGPGHRRVRRGGGRIRSPARRRTRSWRACCATSSRPPGS